MKKKIWLVAVVAAIGISWFVLANKFEKTVYATYLPILEQQKENGLVNLDTNNIKIHKYKFTVVAENFSIFPKFLKDCLDHTIKILSYSMPTLFSDSRF